MFVAFCTWWFRLKNWGFEGSLPEIPKYVIVVAPHTSNWDFIYGVAARNILKTDIKFIGKAELFKFPFKNFFLSLGGIPVNRKQRANAVAAIADYFNKSEQFILALSPEGTRSKVDSLRSGYYHIARSAGVPRVFVGIDYRTRRFVISAPAEPAADWGKEEEDARSFFADIQGKIPNRGLWS
jgi:1-acyl-sn-glycerol-3-phosphate acyltransferase